MLEVLKDEYNKIIGLGAVVLSVIGYAIKKEWLAFPHFSKDRSNLRPEDMPVSQKEFIDGMNSLRSEISTVSDMATEAKAAAQASSASLASIASMIANSMDSFGEKFDQAIARLDKASERIIDRVENHESRISKSEAILEERRPN